jgi:uncharacterized DUF497 family protein
MTGLFEWDAAKEESNLVKHKVDFRRAIEIFDSDVVEVADIRRDYGEVRIRCLGERLRRGLYMARAEPPDHQREKGQ